MTLTFTTLGYPALPPSIQITLQSEHANKSSTKHIFEESIRQSSWSNFSWNGFRLPGQGEPYRTCNKWSVIGCLNSYLHNGKGNYFQPYKKTCSRSSCSECVEAWANKQANRAVRRHVKRMKVLGGKTSHVVFSPPLSAVSWDYKKMDSEFKRIAKQVGMTGASVIFHPARFDKQKTTPYASPHFHTVAYGWFDGEAISKVAREKGWTVKKIRTIKTEGEIFATIKYLLSHTGIKQKIIETKKGTKQLRTSHTVRWIGDVSYRKLRVEKEEKEERVCPECQFELQRLRLKDGLSLLDRPPPPSELLGFSHCNAFEVVDTFEKSIHYDDLWREVKDESKMEREALLESSVTGKKTSFYCQRLEEFVS
ncbi:MAG: hypothetical protein GKS07_06745 [Nitrosopumilus sp.]|nr:MAG: hypothetical protein GKS07_06745 [Nitrosopumilus sp.]